MIKVLMIIIYCSFPDIILPNDYRLTYTDGIYCLGLEYGVVLDDIVKIAQSENFLLGKQKISYNDFLHFSIDLSNDNINYFSSFKEFLEWKKQHHIKNENVLFLKEKKSNFISFIEQLVGMMIILLFFFIFMGLFYVVMSLLSDIGTQITKNFKRSGK